jgi:hypothetical protein
MDADDVVQELGSLRRGRGLHAPDLAGKVGPALRQVCGIDETDNHVTTQSKLIDCIQLHSATLPNDLRLSVLAALGLLEAATYPLLEERLRWVGCRLDRELRTVRRRVEAGARLLAERLVAAAGTIDDEYAPSGWFTDELCSTVRLDVDPPELREQRTIVATCYNLRQVLVSLSVPAKPDHRAAPRVRSRIVHGGCLVAERELASGHYRAILELPRSLAAGERHRYEITLVVSPRDSIRPYYLLSPLRPCRRFRASVTFDHRAVPTAVWRIGGVPRGLVDGAVIPGESLALDQRGRVTTEFYGLRPGLSYGMRWSIPPR